MEEMMIIKVDRDTELAKMLLSFVENCSWDGVKDHIADMLRSWTFSDWETMFAAIADGMWNFLWENSFASQGCPAVANPR